MLACLKCAETAVTCRSFLIGCRQVILFLFKLEKCVGFGGDERRPHHLVVVEARRVNIAAKTRGTVSKNIEKSNV